MRAVHAGHRPAGTRGSRRRRTGASARWLLSATPAGEETVKEVEQKTTSGYITVEMGILRPDRWTIFLYITIMSRLIELVGGRTQRHLVSLCLWYDDAVSDI